MNNTVHNSDLSDILVFNGREYHSSLSKSVLRAWLSPRHVKYDRGLEIANYRF